MQKDEIRERLVELLNTIIDGGFKWHSHLYESGEQLNNDEIASYLIARGVTLATDTNVGSKWIPVSEMLPWTDGAPGYNADFFLVRFTGELQGVECRGFMFTAAYDGDGKWSLPFKPYKDVTDGVTHWMPLP